MEITIETPPDTQINGPDSPTTILLYICYTYSDIEVGLCLKALVTHLALGYVARACVILLQKITNSWKLFSERIYYSRMVLIKLSIN